MSKKFISKSCTNGEDNEDQKIHSLETNSSTESTVSNDRSISLNTSEIALDNGDQGYAERVSYSAKSCQGSSCDSRKEGSSSSNSLRSNDRCCTEKVYLLDSSSFKVHIMKPSDILSDSDNDDNGDSSDVDSSSSDSGGDSRKSASDNSDSDNLSNVDSESESDHEITIRRVVVLGEREKESDENTITETIQSNQISQSDQSGSTDKTSNVSYPDCMSTPRNRGIRKINRSIEETQNNETSEKPMPHDQRERCFIDNSSDSESNNDSFVNSNRLGNVRRIRLAKLASMNTMPITGQAGASTSGQAGVSARAGSNIQSLSDSDSSEPEDSNSPPHWYSIEARSKRRRTPLGKDPEIKLVNT